MKNIGAAHSEHVHYTHSHQISKMYFTIIFSKLILSFMAASHVEAQWNRRMFPIVLHYSIVHVYQLWEPSVFHPCLVSSGWQGTLCLSSVRKICIHSCFCIPECSGLFIKSLLCSNTIKLSLCSMCFKSQSSSVILPVRLICAFHLLPISASSWPDLSESPPASFLPPASGLGGGGGTVYFL